MSAFMVSNQLMEKVVTAILQNTDEFATIQTLRGCLVDDPADWKPARGGRANLQAAVRDELCGDQGALRHLAPAAILQPRWLGRRNPGRAVQSNALPAVSSL